MRPPKKPEEWASLFSVVGMRGYKDILHQVPDMSVDGKYRHWDTLLHLSPPAGLSHREWWFGLKQRRMAASTTLPLMDKTGHPFGFALADPIPEKLHKIDLQMGGQIQVGVDLLNPQTRDQYCIRSLFDEAITSSQLEGASTTRQVAEEMLRKNRPPRDRSEQMILNNYLTMRRIGELRKEPLTKELVLEIHRRITESTLNDPGAAGRFRRESDGSIYVQDTAEGGILHIPPPPGELEERLERLCAFANGKTPGSFVHPAIRAIGLHFMLAYDHPFVDGNGRTARALFFWAMLHYGYWLFEFIAISPFFRKAPARYARAFLYTETDDNDLTYFLLYHFRVIDQAIESLHEYIEKTTGKIRAVERLLRAEIALNIRQRALLAHALRHPLQRYTIAEHQQYHNVVYQTARSDLLELAELGVLRKLKHGRTWYFMPVEDLKHALQELGSGPTPESG